MDNLVAHLKEQQAEEVKHKAYCETQLNENEKTTYTTKQELEDLVDKISELEGSIETLTDEISAAKAQIASTKVEVKKASEQREEENRIFQEEVSDQRAMQQILKKAIARLAKVYGKHAVLAQQAPEPPVQFQPYKKNAGASPVMSLLEQIVGDSVAVEKQAVSTENEAQLAYEGFVKDANDTMDQLFTAIASKSEAITAAQVEKEDNQARKKSTEAQLADLSAYAGDLHEQCDFVIKNFSIRQHSRLQEMEAIQQAKGFLSGMSDDDDSSA